MLATYGVYGSVMRIANDANSRTTTAHGSSANNMGIMEHKLVIGYDATFRNCIINGTVEIRNGSRVMFENVTFYAESLYYWVEGREKGFIEVYDTAEVMIKNSRIIATSWSPRIYVYNTSGITIDNVSIYSTMGGINIYAYGDSSVNIYDCNASTTLYIFLRDYAAAIVINSSIWQILAYDNSGVYLYESINNTYIETHDSSLLYVFGAKMGYGDYISAGDNSHVEIINTVFSSGGIACDGHASVQATQSVLDYIVAEDAANVSLVNTNVSNLWAYDHADLHISGGYFNWIDLYHVPMAGEEAMLGPGGEIKDATITTLHTSSARIIRLINCYVSSLYYLDIFNGSYAYVYVGGYIYDSAYPNYEALGSTIVNTYHISGVAVGNNVDLFVIHRPMNQIVAFNVDRLEIYNITDTGSVIALYTNCYIYNISVYDVEFAFYGSNVTINNLTYKTSGFYFSFLARDSNITIYDSNIEYMDISIYDSKVSFRSVLINNSYLLIENSSGTLDCIMDSTIPDLSDSDIVFNNSVISSTLHIYRSKVGLINTTLYDVIIDEVRLADGVFNMTDGVIISYTVDIISGLYEIEPSNIYSGYISIDYFVLDNASLEIDTYTINVIMGGYVDIDLYNSSKLYLINVSAVYPREVCINVYNDSAIYLFDSDVYTIYAEGDVYIENTGVNQIDIHNSDIEIFHSQISELEMDSSRLVANYTNFSEIEIMSGEVMLDSCYVDDMGGGDLFAFMLNGTICDANITILNSNVSGYHALLGGNLTIKNSNVSEIFAAYQWVDIYDSNIGFALNVSLFTSGSATISNNVITSGTYMVLLHKYGTTVIGSMGYAISILQDPDEPLVDLSIENTFAYPVVVALGGRLDIDNSMFMIVFVNTDTDFRATNSIINASEMEEVPVILVASTLYMDNVTIISEMLILAASNDAQILNSGFNVDGIYIYNTTITITNTDVTPFADPDGTVIANSYVSVEYSTILAATLYESTLHLNVVNVIDANVEGIVLSEGSVLDGDSVNASNILAAYMFKYYFMIFTMVSTYDIPVRNIDVHLVNSRIMEGYIKYYVVDNPLGAEFDNETIMGSYSTLTNYSNSYTTGAVPYFVFRISGSGHANITNYRGGNIIHSIMIMATRDISPPEIAALNASTIEYEYGLERKLCYVLNDETPTNYKVSINDTIIETGIYTSGYTLCVDLATYITSPGYYVVKVYAYDSDLNSVYTTTYVRVHPAEAPLITLEPKDNYTINVGEGIILNWSATDLSPDLYQIIVNGSKVEEKSWASGEVISYEYQAEDVGKVNITIVFQDQLGLKSTDTVILNVTKATTTKKPITYIAIGAIAFLALVVAIILLKRKGKPMKEEE